LLVQEYFEIQIELLDQRPHAFGNGMILTDPAGHGRELHHGLGLRIALGDDIRRLRQQLAVVLTPENRDRIVALVLMHDQHHFSHNRQSVITRNERRNLIGEFLDIARLASPPRQQSNCE
jgi:hypothetical protein